MGKIRKKDLEKQSSVLMTCMACILLILMFCYFGVMNSKATYSDTPIYECPDGYSDNGNGSCCPTGYSYGAGICRKYVTETIRQCFNTSSECSSKATGCDVRYEDGDYVYCGDVKTTKTLTASAVEKIPSEPVCYKCYNDDGSHTYKWSTTGGTGCSVIDLPQSSCSGTGCNLNQGYVDNGSGVCVKVEAKCYQCNNSTKHSITYRWSADAISGCTVVNKTQNACSGTICESGYEKNSAGECVKKGDSSGSDGEYCAATQAACAAKANNCVGEYLAGTDGSQVYLYCGTLKPDVDVDIPEYCATTQAACAAKANNCAGEYLAGTDGSQVYLYCGVLKDTGEDTCHKTNSECEDAYKGYACVKNGNCYEKNPSKVCYVCVSNNKEFGSSYSIPGVPCSLGKSYSSCMALGGNTGIGTIVNITFKNAEGNSVLGRCTTGSNGKISASCIPGDCSAWSLQSVKDGPQNNYITSSGLTSLVWTANTTYYCKAETSTGGGGENPDPTSKPSSSDPTSKPSSSNSTGTPSSNPSSNPNGPSTGDNVNENPKTGSIAIFLAWIVGIGAIMLSIWYFGKLNEEN